MLSELAQYAQSHDLAARAGFKEKAVKGYICLSAAGEFLGIEVREKGAKPVYAPDIGSAANGTRYCNFLIEKAKIPLCMVEDPKKDRNIPTKFEFYLSMLEGGGEFEPKFLVIAEALRNETVRETIISALAQSKLKGGDAVGFVVDNQPMEKSERFLPWWEQFRTMFAPAEGGELSRCLISGELTRPLPTVPKVTGLISVGGHTSGDAFLCFDKDAFQSYGLKKSANAPVSEESMTAVNAALAELLKTAPVFGGAKMVHWYAGDVPEEVDPFADMMEGLWDEDEPSESEPQPDSEQERQANLAAKEFFDSIQDGKRPDALTARYYIMPLSGAGGRMMVRGWYEGSFEDLYRNLDSWFVDLRLVTCGGKGLTKPPKLKAICTRLLKPGGDPLKVWDRMDSELANLSGRLMGAIINGNPLPDEVANRALRYIRSGMLSASEEEGKRPSIQAESMAFQLLKAWLVRRQRQRGDETMIGETLTQEMAPPAYCCGRLMAVYGAIQSAAMPEVNVGVADRYYTAASTTPAFVIGKLAQLSTHHLSKLDQDKPGLAAFYRKQLEAIAVQLGGAQLPRSLNLEQQTQFALGYYQQRAAMYTSNDK